MAIRKLESPCKICKGKSKIRCLICGWKAEKKLKHQMTPMEMAEETGQKNYEEWMAQTHNQLKKYNMDSTGVASVDEQVKKEKGPWKDL